MEIEIVSMDSAEKDEVVIMAKIRKHPHWLHFKDSKEKEEIDAGRKEITLLHLGKAELTQKEDE